jgi:hypothetical protein
VHTVMFDRVCRYPPRRLCRSSDFCPYHRVPMSSANWLLRGRRSVAGRHRCAEGQAGDYRFPHVWLSSRGIPRRQRVRPNRRRQRFRGQSCSSTEILSFAEVAHRTNCEPSEAKPCRVSGVTVCSRGRLDGFRNRNEGATSCTHAGRRGIINRLVLRALFSVSSCLPS